MSMDGSKNIGLWMPGTAVLISLLLSVFTTPPSPLLDSRPPTPPIIAAAPRDIQQIEARLWEDPLTALTRAETNTAETSSSLPDRIAELRNAGKEVDVLAVMLPGGPHAEDTEQRRRARYAVLAGLNGHGLIPEDSQHLGAHIFPALCDNQGRGDHSSHLQNTVAYEFFLANPLRKDLLNDPHKSQQIILVLWLREEDLAAQPLARLQFWLQDLLRSTTAQPQPHEPLPVRVIGPHSSQTLVAMINELPRPATLACTSTAQTQKTSPSPDALDIEIYSPSATAEERLLLDAADNLSSSTLAQREPSEDLATRLKQSRIKLLRTVADDRSNAMVLVDELKRRGVDPVTEYKRMRENKDERCADQNSRQGAGHHIALVSEWDSFYSRALPRSIKREIGCRIDNGELCNHNPTAADASTINDSSFDWVLRYSYLRGLDGQLPSQSKSGSENKTDNKKEPIRYTTQGEHADHDAQLDYLRRLADTIAMQDEKFRSKGDCGIGAIGILGSDPYDKLLVLQALKQRFPGKIFFSTDLDARLLQSEQSNWTRNLVLAAPFNLALRPELQYDTPPFRDSMQSSTFLSVLLALDDSAFAAKNAFIKHAQNQTLANCGFFLTPGIYEVGNNGFIGLSSKNNCPSAVRTAHSPQFLEQRAATEKSLLKLESFQIEPPDAYPPIPQFVKRGLHKVATIYGAVFLIGLLAALMALQIWTQQKPNTIRTRSEIQRWIASGLFIGSLLAMYCSLLWWKPYFLFGATGLLLAAALLSNSRGAGPGKPTLAYIYLPVLFFCTAITAIYFFRDFLTEHGFGEPLFFFSGISTWPTQLIRLIAILFAIASLCWGWHLLAKNMVAMQHEFLVPRRTTQELLEPLKRQIRQTPNQRERWRKRAAILLRVLLPLRDRFLKEEFVSHADSNKLAEIDGHAFWIEHQLCGIPYFRLLRAALMTWIYLLCTSLLFAIWPPEWPPIRGSVATSVNFWMLLLSIVTFNFLIFWVVDANLLLARLITVLSGTQTRWSREFHKKLADKFGIGDNPAADDWLDIRLIARRTAAVNKIIYAPVLVMMLLMAARSSLFDNWIMTPSLAMTYMLGSAILLFAAWHLRSAAERARNVAIARIKALNLKLQGQTDLPNQRVILDQLKLILDEIQQIREGAFARYTDQPIVHAVLIVVGSMGGSAVVDYMKALQF